MMAERTHGSRFVSGYLFFTTAEYPVFPQVPSISRFAEQRFRRLIAQNTGSAGNLREALETGVA